MHLSTMGGLWQIYCPPAVTVRENYGGQPVIVAVCGGESTLVGGEPTQPVRRTRFGQAVRFAVLCTATTHKTIRQLCSYIRIAQQREWRLWAVAGRSRATERRHRRAEFQTRKGNKIFLSYYYLIIRTLFSQNNVIKVFKRSYSHYRRLSF